MKKFLSDSILITAGGLVNRTKGFIFIPVIVTYIGLWSSARKMTISGKAAVSLATTSPPASSRPAISLVSFYLPSCWDFWVLSSFFWWLDGSMTFSWKATICSLCNTLLLYWQPTFATQTSANTCWLSKSSRPTPPSHSFMTYYPISPSSAGPSIGEVS